MAGDLVAPKMASLKPEDLDAAALMTSQAFAQSPVYAYVLRAQPMIGSPADPVSVLYWLFRRNFALRMEINACRAGLNEDGIILCFYILEPPEAMEPLPLSTMLWAGLCTFALPDSPYFQLPRR